MQTSTQQVITEGQIAARVRDLGRQIEKDCQGAPILLLAVLKGAVLFVADLMRCIEGDVLIDFFVVSSYASDRHAAQVVVHHAPRTDLAGRHVILVDEIVDTGRTIAALLERYVEGRGAASVRVCTLLDKAAAREVPVRLDYVGFTAPDLWLVGYGMDSDGFGRNLPDIRAVPQASPGG